MGAKKEKKPLAAVPEDAAVEPSTIKSSHRPVRAVKAKNDPKQAEEYREMMKNIRDKFRDFSEENFDKFMQAWARILDPEKKCNIYLQMCKFVVPSLTSVDLEVSDKKNDTFTAKLLILRDQAEAEAKGAKKA